MSFNLIKMLQKRVILTKRRYYYIDIGPFSFGLALPERYGLRLVNNSQINYIVTSYKNKVKDQLKMTNNWRVHPEWYVGPSIWSLNNFFAP